MSFADPNFIKSIGVEYSEMISFAGGWVNHAAPKELKEAYENILANESLFHQSGAYPPTLGDPEFKRSVIDFEEHVYDMKELDPSQIAAGLGSTQLAMALFEVLLDPGDKILLLDPSYCNYPTQIVSGIIDINVLRFPVLDPDTWEYQADEKIEEFYDYIIKNKPRLILLISPDNPTSKVLSDEFVKSTVDAARQVGSFVVVDFAYKEITFHDKLPEYFSWSPSENFISLRSNSKWCRGLGRRLGWVEAPDYVIESMESIQNSTILCPDKLHQMAFTYYTRRAIQENTLLPYLDNVRSLYRSAADKTIESIETYLNLPAIVPEGGLYTCIKMGMDGAKVVNDVLKNTGVLFVPGWGFGKTIKDAVRVSYGPLVHDHKKIELGFIKVAELLKK